MTWEIAVGLFTLVSALISVMNVVVKVNRTLTSLEGAVNRLNVSMEKQSTKNREIFDELDDHSLRLAIPEEHDKTKEKGNNNEN